MATFNTNGAMSAKIWSKIVMREAMKKSLLAKLWTYSWPEYRPLVYAYVNGSQEKQVVELAPGDKVWFESSYGSMGEAIFLKVTADTCECELPVVSVSWNDKYEVEYEDHTITKHINRDRIHTVQQQ